MRRRVVVSLAIGISALAASTARAETLEDALASAYTGNPQVLGERATLRAADEGVPQALSGWRPTVTFQGGIGAETSESTPPTITQPAHAGFQPHTYSLTLTQPIYNGGGTIAKTAQAEDLVQSERAHLISVESSVLFTAAQSYFDVLRDQAVIDLDKNNEQVLGRQLEATNDQFRVGQVTRTDVAQAEARLAQATAQRHVDEGLLEIDSASYTRAVGHPPIALEQPKMRPVIPGTRDQALALAATKNPSVISAQFAEDAARDNVAQIKAQLLPSVSIVGNVQRLQETQGNAREITNQSVIAQLNIPLYEGGNIWSQSRQAVENVGKAKGATDDTRRQAVQTATQSWETIQSARSTITSLQSTIRAAQIALEGVQQQQQVGARTVLDVLNAQQELFADQVALVRAQHDLAVAEFNLAQQVGVLTAVDLKLPVKLYDVDTHYRSVRDKLLGFGARDE
ncbi:MAG TPA: TolC family outer membrane protein [Stellaceae bacterium]|nr:TolC family outer membrane protein [Stellaceae bacterium]